MFPDLSFTGSHLALHQTQLSLTAISPELKQVRQSLDSELHKKGFLSYKCKQINQRASCAAPLNPVIQTPHPSVCIMSLAPCIYHPHPLQMLRIKINLSYQIRESYPPILFSTLTYYLG